MFKQAKYFFEPLIETELNLIAQTEIEKQQLKQIIFCHLIFVFLSHGQRNMRPSLTTIIKENQFDYQLIDKLSQLEPTINQELVEKSLTFILTNIQARLETATV